MGLRVFVTLFRTESNNSTIFWARDLKFSPKILKKYFKIDLKKMADEKTKWPTQPSYELET